MKHLKLIIALFTVTAIIFSCNPKDEKKPDTTPPVSVGKKMSYDQLAKEIGATNALTAFDKAGLTESDPAARGSKRPKPGVQLTVLEDLILTQVSANDFTSTTSVNAQWFSYQVFVTGASPDPNAGAYAICNHYYNAPGTAPSIEPCTITTAGTVRTFTSDFDYTVHLSAKIVKP